jgi:biotin-(acetyl-CoA carboxylase) ligase
MFNGGMNRTYWMPSKKELEASLKSITGTAYKDTTAKDMLEELSNEIYTYMDNPKTTNFFTNSERYTHKDLQIGGRENKEYDARVKALTADANDNASSTGAT